MQANVIIVLSLLLLLFSCNKEVKDNGNSHADHDMSSNSDSSKNVTYWCPMDTQVVQQGPGSCPICGMDLEPKPGAHHHTTLGEKDWVYTPANVAVLSTIKSVKPVMKSLANTILATGYIVYDDRRIYSIPAKVGGRIEKLYVKYNFQPIKKGQALFEIFSHDLQTAQQEYIFIQKNDPSAIEVIRAAKNKLLLLGMTEQQIDKIRTADHIHATTTVYSPHSGFVVEKPLNKQPIASTGAMDNSSMGTASNGNESTKELSIREGAYVGKGESVFTIANTDIVWAVFEVYSNQLTQIKINQPIHIKVENTKEVLMGKINFIEPSYKQGSGTTKLRVYLNNKDQNLKIGSLLSGEIESGQKKGLYVSQSAVVDLGVDKIVFVKNKGAFETRKVSIGNKSGNEVEIINGLKESEEVAENAQYMVDSESFIKVSK